MERVISSALQVNVLPPQKLQIVVLRTEVVLEVPREVVREVVLEVPQVAVLEVQVEAVRLVL